MRRDVWLAAQATVVPRRFDALSPLQGRFHHDPLLSFPVLPPVPAIVAVQPAPAVPAPCPPRSPAAANEWPTATVPPKERPGLPGRLASALPRRT